MKLAAAFERGPRKPVPATDRSIPTLIGAVPVRQHLPDGTPRGVYIDIHGGGFFMGSPRMNDWRNHRLALQHKLVVLSIDYRLAPEHPYPAGLDDCEQVALWVLQSGAAEFGTSRLFIGGGSAGASLAASTVLRLRDRHDAAAAVSGMNLVYGAYDLTGTPSVGGNSKPWVDAYLPAITGDDRRAPDISPLYADLRHLPPAFFTVGTLDNLLDDTLFMAMRWRAAGNDTRLEVYPESVHGFDAFPTAMGAAAWSRIGDWFESSIADS